MRTIIFLIIFLTGWFVTGATEAQAMPTGIADQTTVKVENRQTATATVTQEMGML